MYQRRPSKFNKYRSNGRRFQSRGNGSNKSNGQIRSRSQLFNDQPRNKFRPIHNPEKLFEKYSTLAKEALSSGDKTLSENYLQHADHFTRILNEQESQRRSRFSDSKSVEGTSDVEQKSENVEDKVETVNNISEIKPSIKKSTESN